MTGDEERRPVMRMRTRKGTTAGLPALEVGMERSWVQRFLRDVGGLNLTVPRVTAARDPASLVQGRENRRRFGSRCDTATAYSAGSAERKVPCKSLTIGQGG